MEDGRKIARISKKWVGLLRQALTHADTFRLEFQDGKLGPDLRKLQLMATFLIDITCFERS